MKDNMRKFFYLSLLGAAAAATCTTAMAQTAPSAATVQIYGVLDTGVETLDNVGPGQVRLTRIPSNTGTVPSRFGFRGSEDLGGGLSAVFNLEAGIAMDTGTSGQGGRMFGRQASVGINSPLGSITLGRLYSMLFYSQLDADILGPNIYGASALDSYIPNARQDNAIAYRGTFSGLTLGASYSFGRDTVNAGPSPGGTNCAGESGSDSQACRAQSYMLKYDASGWGVAVAYDEQRGRTTTGPTDIVLPLGLNSSNKKDTRTVVNGYFKLSDVKIGAGVIQRDNDGDVLKSKSNLWYIGAAYPLTPFWTIDGQVYKLDYNDSPNFNATLYAARALYAFSKRTSVYGQVGHIKNSAASILSASGGQPGSNTAPGVSQTGFMFGVRHAF